MRNPLRDETAAAWDDLRGETVLVNLQTGGSLRGTVWATHAGHVELRDVTVISGQQRLDAVDQIRFPEAALSWYQVIHTAIPADADQARGPSRLAA